MMKSLMTVLTIAMPAFITYVATTTGASLATFTFADDDNGPVLEHYPATATKATVNGSTSCRSR
jgi:hypothetical protein